MKKAVILFNLGGPDKLENVEPFLFNLFNDPAILNLPSFFRYPLAKLIANRRAPTAKKIYKELKESHKHIGLLSYSLDRKLDAFKYHFGETDSYKEACLEHADFLEEHETLINQFFEWIEAGD